MQLDEQATKTNTLKLPEIGDYADGILCHVDNSRQAHDIDGNPKTWTDGTPRMTKIVWLSITNASPGAVNSATETTPQPGDLLAVFVEGGTFIDGMVA